MKNLHYYFNPGAKYETHYQSGFQRIIGFILCHSGNVIPENKTGNFMLVCSAGSRTLMHLQKFIRNFIPGVHPFVPLHQHIMRR